MNGQVIEPIKRKSKMRREYKRKRKLGGKIRRHRQGMTRIKSGAVGSE